MKQGFIFDADGTLLDSTGMWIEAGARYLKTLGYDAEPQLGQTMLAMTLTDSADYIKQHYPLSLTRDEIMEGINQSMRSFYLEEVKLKPGVKDFLATLHGLGFPMAVATATDHEIIEDGLRHCGVLEYFKGIFTCEEVGHGKDQPEIYLAAQALLGTDRSSTWVFEDALHGAQTAKKAGFLLAAVYDAMSHNNQEELKVLADLYLKDFCNMNAFVASLTK